MRSRVAVYEDGVPGSSGVEGCDGDGTVGEDGVGDVVPHGPGADEGREVFVNPEALCEIKVVVFVGGVVGVDVDEGVIPAGRVVGSATADAAATGRANAAHHVADSCPPVEALRVDEG